MSKYKYFLSVKLGGEKVEREVSVEEYCKAERAAGFRPKMSSDHPDYMRTPATGGFGSGYGDSSISGSVRLDKGDEPMSLTDQLKKQKEISMRYKELADCLLSTIQQTSESMGHLFPSLNTLTEVSIEFRNKFVKELEK